MTDNFACSQSLAEHFLLAKFGLLWFLGYDRPLLIHCQSKSKLLRHYDETEVPDMLGFFFFVLCVGGGSEMAGRFLMLSHNIAYTNTFARLSARFLSLCASQVVSFVQQHVGGYKTQILAINDANNFTFTLPKMPQCGTTVGPYFNLSIDRWRWPPI